MPRSGYASITIEENKKEELEQLRQWFRARSHKEVMEYLIEKEVRDMEAQLRNAMSFQVTRKNGPRGKYTFTATGYVTQITGKPQKIYELSVITNKPTKKLAGTLSRQNILFAWETANMKTITELAKKPREEVKEDLKALSKNKLEKIRYAASRAIEEEYERGRGHPQYGLLSRRLSKEQLIRFFKAIKNPVVKQAFLIQFFYGLRIGELKDVRIAMYQDILIIEPEEGLTKGGREKEYLPLIHGTELLFEGLEYIKELSPHYLRKCFRAVCRDAGEDLCFIYSKAKNTGRNQYLYTSHSLRHTAIDEVRRGSDELAAQLFARHSQSHKFGVTATYFHKSFDELREDVSEALRDYVMLLLGVDGIDERRKEKGTKEETREVL